jgi:DnaJ-domain-containing protein 1
MFAELGGRAARGAGPEPEGKPDAPPIRNAERKALETLGLEPGVTAVEIKTRFKALVKRHHPDANGGDKSTENRLVEIIQSYNYLKSVGLS